MATNSMAEQDMGTAELPPALFGRWTHSHEEDLGDLEVYRPPDFDFPPARGRDGFEMRPSGEFVRHDSGPADEPVQVPGRWRAEGAGRVVVSFDAGREGYAFTVVDADATVLRLIRAAATSGGQSAPAASGALAPRTSIRAFRAGRHVLLLAEGELPSAGSEVDIRQSPMRIFPPEFELVAHQRPGVWPSVVVPYRYGEVVPYPADQPVVTVHHADGSDRIEIEQPGAELADFTAALSDGRAQSLPPGVTEVTGTSRRLSFDEAFADAVAQIPSSWPPRPDSLTSVSVVDIRGMFGGVAGFHHLLVTVRGRSD